LSALSGLSAASLAPLLTAAVTSPILARALGPEGRGVLASILVPLSLAPLVAQLGLGLYVSREAARARSPGLLVGSIGLPLLVIGAVVGLFADPLASVFIDEKAPSHAYLTVGLSLLAISLLINLLRDLTWGREQWRRFSGVAAAPHVLYALGLSMLFVLGELTVGSSFVVFLVSGLLPLLPLLWFCRDAWPPRLDVRITGEGLAFGSKVWLGTLGTLANERLDQLLMIRLVPAAELGLYAVAVSVSAIPNFAAVAIGNYLLPRVAAGDERLATRAVRVGIALAAGFAGAIGLAAPVVLPAVFGYDFSRSVTLLWILLVGLIPFSTSSMLRQALSGSGIPVAAMYAELTALAFMIPALLIGLPLLGAVGAAIVSVVSYSLSAGILLGFARKHFRRPLHEFLLIRPDDLRWFIAVLRGRRRI
jgi:O-antigen/teichoic acid export membrane protein